MIISEKNQKSNRQNAQHSTGPKTTEGKAAIRFNALTYGLRTRATTTPGSGTNWKPQDRTERCYLETMVTSQWLLARVADSERKVYEFIEFSEKQFVMLGYVSKQRAQLERSFRTAIEDMKQSQKERQARQPQQPAQTAQPAKPAAAPVPQPDYVMSEGTQARAKRTHPPSSLDPTIWALIVLPRPSHIAPRRAWLDRFDQVDQLCVAILLLDPLQIILITREFARRASQPLRPEPLPVAMQRVHNLAAAHDHRVILHAGSGKRLDSRLPRGVAAAEEAEASVRQPQSAGDQVEPQRLELPTYRSHARRPLAELPVEAQHREEKVLEAIAPELLQQHRTAGQSQPRLAGIFQHALRLRVADRRRELRARPAAAQRQRLVTLGGEDAERVAHVRFVEPVFVLMPSMPPAALIDGVPGDHQQAAVHSTVTLLARLPELLQQPRPAGTRQPRLAGIF